MATCNRLVRLFCFIVMPDMDAVLILLDNKIIFILQLVRGSSACY